MSMIERIDELRAVIEANPRFLKLVETDELSGARELLITGIDQLTGKLAEIEARETLQKLDLIAHIVQTKHDTSEWLSANSPTKRFYIRSNRQEIEEFVNESLEAGTIQSLIDELSGAKGRRLNDKLNRWAIGGIDEARLELDGMSDEELIDLCNANEIKVFRTAKVPFNRKKTVTEVEKKISTLREYLKLMSDSGAPHLADE